MATGLDDARKNIPTEVDAGQDNKGHVREVSVHPGPAGTTQHSLGLPGVLSQRVSGTVAVTVVCGTSAGCLTIDKGCYCTVVSAYMSYSFSSLASYII